MRSTITPTQNVSRSETNAIPSRCSATSSAGLEIADVFEIVFYGMIATLDLEVARSVGGPIEWDFSDTDAWHLVVTNGHAEAKPGKAGEPALRLECSSAGWAKIAVGRSILARVC